MRALDTGNTVAGYVRSVISCRCRKKMTMRKILKRDSNMTAKIHSPQSIVLGCRYDVAVVGAGPAGMMAAIRAAQLKQTVILLERNDAPGRKMLLTGKGRCNLTNSASLEVFMEKFGKPGLFLRSAFSAFSNRDLIEFFSRQGLRMKTERQGRIFPVTDHAASVVESLRRALEKGGVELCCGKRVMWIERKGDVFRLELADESVIAARKVILATGGISYPATGSRGDGLRLAEKMGHRIEPLFPALVPLRTAEEWVKDMAGLTLRNVRITFVAGKKRISSEVGELLFTHFGVSGPLVLDLSGSVISLPGQDNERIQLLIDLKPGLTPEQLERRLLREFLAKKNVALKNLMKELLPMKMIAVILRLAGVNGDKKVHQVSREERRLLIERMKSLTLTITGSLPIEEAMVTGGGVSLREIDPRTMESRIVRGLYFAGEMIEGCAPSGGYNLQQAFSTGWLAGSTD